MKAKPQLELIYLDMTLKMPFKWNTGEPLGEFFRELRDNGKIYSNQCPTCKRNFCPPVNICTRDHSKCNEKDKWLAVGPKGTLLTFFICEQSFLIPTTGEMLEVPFSVGLVMLDGSPVVLQHHLEETDVAKIKPGMRVEAIFKPKGERKGNIFDIIHFKTIQE